MRLSDRLEVGDEIKVSLKEKILPHIYLVKDKKSLKLESINDFIAYLDTGYDKKNCANLLMTFYKNKNINWTTQKINLYLIVRID